MTTGISGNRQLACIMFSDIIGYTLVMGEDENKAFQILKRNREIQKPIIERFGGKWIKELGDGVLATFSSVTHAVLAAAAIQAICKTETSYDLRIGLHLSEVIFENSDVFGDGVNVAARIQSLAAVGGIVISETVQKNLINKRGIETKSLGVGNLKNVKEDINLFEVIITSEYEDIPFSDPKMPARIVSTGKSIAVLPFRNLNKDEEQEYFSDGIAEEIIVTLSNIDNLKVVGRSSSFQFKENVIPVTDVGRVLGVTTVLEGSVRRHGTRLRIYAALINVEDGCQLWAERYDRDLTDIFQIQDDIAAHIAQKLKVKFFGEDSRTIPINMEAYEWLLKGRFYLEKYIEGFEKALACFTRAVEIDPNYGEAYCELAKVHFLYTMNLLYTPAQGFERAKFYAEKALSLNKELGAAHYLLGQINFWYHWDFGKSKLEYELAEHCNDSFYFTGVVIDPWYKAFGYGDYEGAIQSIYKIIETDPLSFYAQLHLGYFYTFGRQPEKAKEVLNKMLSMVPNFSEAERLIAYNYLLEGDNENALLYARKAAQMAHGLGWAQNLFMIALAKSGQHGEARKLLAEWELQKGPLNISPLGIGLVFSFLGDLDSAFEYFNKAIDYHDIWAVAFRYSAEFDHVRHDPRFQDLLDRIGYPN
jgi:adenylate cyclase